MLYFDPGRSYLQETTSMLKRTYRYNRYRIIIALLRLKMLLRLKKANFNIIQFLYLWTIIIFFIITIQTITNTRKE